MCHRKNAARPFNDTNSRAEIYFQSASVYQGAPISHVVTCAKHNRRLTHHFGCDKGYADSYKEGTTIMANKILADLRAKLHCTAKGYPPAVAETIKLSLTHVRDEDIDSALAMFDQDHVEYLPTVAPVTIDAALEERAWGKENNFTVQGTLTKQYGDVGYAERKLAYLASKTSDTVVAKAAEIVERDNEFSNSPFNPKKVLTSDVRINECAKFIRAFGPKKTAQHAAKFGTDIAGRPLAKRA